MCAGCGAGNPPGARFCVECPETQHPGAGKRTLGECRPRQCPAGRHPVGERRRSTRAHPGAGDLAALYRTVGSGGAVRIETTACGGGSVGTGFLVAPGLVATAAHVLAGARVIVVRADSGGRIGDVIGLDEGHDLALVRTTPRSLSGHVFPLADADPEVGATVAAIGYPLAGPRSLTRGAVSALLPGFIQTDAAVNPGNSGGPLLTRRHRGRHRRREETRRRGHRLCPACHRRRALVARVGGRSCSTPARRELFGRRRLQSDRRGRHGRDLAPGRRRHRPGPAHVDGHQHRRLRGHPRTGSGPTSSNRTALAASARDMRRPTSSTRTWSGCGGCVNGSTGPSSASRASRTPLTGGRGRPAPVGGSRTR